MLRISRKAEEYRKLAYHHLVLVPDPGSSLSSSTLHRRIRHPHPHHRLHHRPQICQLCQKRNKKFLFCYFLKLKFQQLSRMTVLGELRSLKWNLLS